MFWFCGVPCESLYIFSPLFTQNGVLGMARFIRNNPEHVIPNTWCLLKNLQTKTTVNSDFMSYTSLQTQLNEKSSIQYSLRATKTTLFNLKLEYCDNTTLAWSVVCI